MTKKLMKGSEAIGEAAVQAGCKLFFGYPITPQNEIPEYMSMRLPQIGGAFVQAESEVAASNMIYGAAGTGERVMTSSSSPGISLMAEAISYLAGSELPVVIVNIVRAGPGLGGILPSQGDYFQATKASGHGDFRVLVLAPWSIQEAADLVQDAFDLADYYRNPVMILGDGLIGQMMEPVEFSEGRAPIKELEPKTWATTGCDGSRPTNVVNSLFLDPEELEQHNIHLKAKYDLMVADEVRYADLRNRRRLRRPDRRLRDRGPGLLHRDRRAPRGGHQGRDDPPHHPVPVPLRGGARGRAEGERGARGRALGRSDDRGRASSPWLAAGRSTFTTAWAACWCRRTRWWPRSRQ